jgi:hypothetical protein
MYFTVTTITTVGYGDMSAWTRNERYESISSNHIFRIFAIILMLIGVCSYSFAIGSITNVLRNLDTKEAQFKERLGILDDIKEKSGIANEFYFRILKQLKYDHNKNANDQFKLLDDLPPNLKHELSFILHEEIIRKFPFFQNKAKGFISLLGPKLKPMKIAKGDYIYQEGDDIDEIYFLISGQVGFVLENELKCKNDVYAKVREGIN